MLTHAVNSHSRYSSEVAHSLLTFCLKSCQLPTKENHRKEVCATEKQRKEVQPTDKAAPDDIQNAASFIVDYVSVTLTCLRRKSCITWTLEITQK